MHKLHAWMSGIVALHGVSEKHCLEKQVFKIHKVMTFAAGWPIQGGGG